jgi:tight adherence protein C
MTMAPAHAMVALGAARLGPVEASMLFLATAAALLSAALLWRIGQREDREARLSALGKTVSAGTDQAKKPRSPWHHRVGRSIAAMRLVGAPEQKRLLSALAAAGIRREGRLSLILVAKAFGSFSLALACWGLFARYVPAGGAAFPTAVTGAALVGGWRFPELVLTRLRARRKRRIDIALPDALDLLVVCVEAGLSLDQAIEQVGHDLRRSRAEVAEEFSVTAAEMRVLPDRAQALENLARRTEVASLRGIIAVLNQSIRYGTPLARALRVLSADLRAERLARFEERAARLPVLLTLPLMAFILPSLVMVVGAPLALHILDALRSIAERSH